MNSTKFKIMIVTAEKNKHDKYFWISKVYDGYSKLSKILELEIRDNEANEIEYFRLYIC